MMSREELQREKNREYEERHDLAVGRLREIVAEDTVPEKYLVYFRDVTIFLLEMENVRRKIESGEWERYSVKEMQSINEILYIDVMEDRYEISFANPAYACGQFASNLSDTFCYHFLLLLSVVSFFGGYTSGLSSGSAL